MNPTDEKVESKGTAFFKEVAKYFMDFLETDFHKHKLPRRNIKYRNEDNLLTGLNLQKYPIFNKLILKLITKNFSKEVLSKIGKGEYKTSLPKNLIDLIKLQVGKIKASEVNEVIDEISSEIEKLAVLHEKEYDVALNGSIEVVTKKINSALVNPFIQSIEKPLQNLNLADEDNVFLIEDELTSVLVRQMESKVSEILNLSIAKVQVNIAKELKSVFAVEDIKTTLITFFEDLQVADLFSEVFEMERNKRMQENQDFYLYFGDISFKNIKYPIFYIPVSVTKKDEELLIDFDSQVYVNKRALEFIVQEYNLIKGGQGNLQHISERIIYLAQHETDLQALLDKILAEISNFFELTGSVTFSSSETVIAKGANVRMSNSCSLCLFDKSDEALVNDYEEILQQLGADEGDLSGAFNLLLGDFLNKNPEACNPDVEREWDNTEITDKLVVPSPIPLNSEQHQILSALKKDNCKYMIVQGPPGTGKSHTITAIIFDAILHGKSVLVLSDKKEALDVVEDKITQTMNKVRFDKNFQNPILRLGKTGNTYSKILSQATIEGIKTHFRAVRQEHEVIEQNIGKSTNSLKEDLEAEIISYEDINLEEIKELAALESYLKGKNDYFDTEEVLSFGEGAFDLGEIKITLEKLSTILNGKDMESLYKFLSLPKDHVRTISEYQKLTKFVSTTLETINKIKETFGAKLQVVQDFLSFSSDDLLDLNQFINEYVKEKKALVGYLFNKKKVAEIDFCFKQRFQSVFVSPHQDLAKLKDALGIFGFADTLGKDINNKLSTTFDFVSLVHSILRDEALVNTLKEVIKTDECIILIEQFNEKYPKTAKLSGVTLSDFNNFKKNTFLSIDNFLFDKQLRYLDLRQKITSDFSKVTDLNYALRKRNIEDLVITQVAYLLDGRLINFYEHNRNDAETLRNIIKNKEKFPKNEFKKLKEAFPCILAGIRDYAEYIPLEHGIFDLVIIDEASQVSVAQAFPALLRAKKVLILGDKKQFSNIKAAQARSDTNREYLNSLQDVFKRTVSTEATKLVRLGKFNIKTSILEFFEFISNYNTQLKKHFRGYKELISYSNKNFYQDNLEVMKIRGKAIDEVIKFSFVEPSIEDEVHPNTNLKEIEFIIEALKKLKEEKKNVSVGIITPHTNQQKLLVEKINSLPERDYYLETLALKIMTFDTCQGEERDIIFYSMVASKHSDKLWAVFIKDLSKVDVEEDGQIKAQRLNVGFSRAKECMHFVLSKPIDDFSGSAGDALRHYIFTLEEAKKEKSVSEVDAKSAKEPEVLHWFYQTKFWKENTKSIEFQPQFEIGKYLKQLDKTYTHPAYKVDFLLIYRDEQSKEHKIIIEYDGFQEHFGGNENVNQYNYKNYYSDDDVYRQKVLESYGYKFLRINRFNVGKNPVETFNERIEKLLENEPVDNPLLHNIHNTVEGLQNGQMKECPKCKEVRTLQDFKDKALITGYGRFCSYCKNAKITNTRESHAQERAERPKPVLSNILCPRCNSRMILRDSRRGKFYGCSRFPSCRGTRNV
jgi:very-short-patch-repair endonuclease